MAARFAPKLPHSAGNTMPFTRNRFFFASPFVRLTQVVAKLRKKEKEREELYHMTCRELRDIGLTRGDIEHVFNRTFPSEFARPGKPPLEGGKQ